MMISDIEAAHILIAISRSKPRVVVKAVEKENTLPVPVPVPRQKRSSYRRKIRRSFPMDPSCSSSSSTALVAYVSQEDYPYDYVPPSPSMASPRIPRLSRKKRPRVSSSTALVEYASQEDASPPTRLPLSRKKRPRPLPPKAKQPKKKARRVDDSLFRSEPTPDWLLKLMKEEEEPKKIIEKELTGTDLNHNHNRLSMPCSSIIDFEFLSLAEQEMIAVDEGKRNKTGINARLVVKFVDSDVLKEFGVNLRRWKMPKEKGPPTFIFNLVTGWNKVVEGCGLHENDRIRVWSFHSDGQLCFAIALATPSPPSHPLLLLPPPPTASDSEDANPEEMSSALVIYDQSNDDLQST